MFPLLLEDILGETNYSQGINSNNSAVPELYNCLKFSFPSSGTNC